MNFFEKLSGAIAKNQSLLFVGLDPNLEMMPTYYASSDIMSSLLDWLQFIISETSNKVCAYKPTLGFYEALGVPGLELLHKILATIPADIPVILDTKHNDLNTGTMFARTVFSQWGVDAITVTPYAGQDNVAPFLLYPEKAVFVLCCTSNPAAATFQEYPTNPTELPLYLQVAKESKNWGTPEQLCLEVGTTKPDILARIRTIVPERIIMARSIWGEKNILPKILTSGLTASGDGLLIPVPQDILGHSDLSKQVQSLQEQVNQVRNEIIRDASSCSVWLPDVCFLNQHPHQELILQLYDIGCIMFGKFVQASGATFPYYIDLRKIISNPQLFNQVLSAYEEILQTLTFDRLAGIPYGSLPTATGLSLRLHCPMIFPRKEVKAHGTRRLIEGEFNPGEKVVVVDDILISGKSAMEGAEKLKSAGLNVDDIVVLIDHGQGVQDRLRENGYQAHAVLKLSEIIETLYQAGRINEEEFNSFYQE
ncbi:bifunctional orotidine-5'-phosphate decarboxylase/orotate phosphoribosyltransferase [Aetokthonos hydrillicola Thurmond2011]|jgi:uridine monophosphate synthetase|uniref:Orotate phosphoribosyltransferase n=1 Tax=Aetokthonos hydrillicola Thurmond2011 TaxID=2712845 RepID=A0AAP5IAJ7_9CYAN|nr:bifunctional orotidine-5'-phosphate decarboxylase/orotate phosphoribosyltransferase [Aetokthonos hydrillicola]MBO3460584.1 bifunctional orotidine-5'-phosphate decarboxylase/orotate phosphoribosyltransferase [Aetokthonos hydrillicola CCALA 1050]MBW4585288.1 bifunctional orotidine-5'-phosphate decarboxylase/orotate phosphoribosyltransferase [Aetokthonos hydrillicola CCALA 1050]MDR9896577.1 bifunctional orotidine-5'-phosphate decarboxylase/orotate phosphoribosyltransferase [Aetokthonos hydrillic